MKSDLSEFGFLKLYFCISFFSRTIMNNIPTQALAVGIPVGLLLMTHLKSLPLAYTVRSWFLLRALIRQAKDNKLKPDRM